jgi:hypothetical protein
LHLGNDGLDQLPERVRDRLHLRREVANEILILPEASTGSVMEVNEHANTIGVKLTVAAEGAGLADEVGTTLAQDGVEAITPAEIASLGRGGTVASWRQHTAVDVQLVGV